MDENEGFSGLFYRTDFPDNRVPGTLQYDKDGKPILTLAHDFVPFDYEDFTFLDGTHPARKDPRFIIGFNTHPEHHVTLYRCRHLATAYYHSKITSVPIFPKYTAEFVFNNAYFSYDEEVLFREIWVHYTHLDEWLDVSGVMLSERPNEIRIRYTHADPVHALTTNAYSIYFDVSAIASYTWQKAVFHKRKDASITQTSYVVLKFPEPHPLEDCMAILEHIRKFLSLAILQPVYPLYIQAIPEANIALRPEKRYVYLYTPQPDMVAASKYPMELDMLFTFETAKGHIEAILTNWMKKSDLLEPITELYLGTLYNPKLYPYNRFLNLAHAIETYHRRTHDNRELTRAEHRARVRAIVSSAPEQYKKWLKERLVYSNEPSLKNRMIGLFSDFSSVLNKLVTDQDTFISSLVDTRNYYTHYDERLRPRAAKGSDLILMSNQLQSIVEICLLHELGFSKKEIEHLMTANIRYLDSDEHRQQMIREGFVPFTPTRRSNAATSAQSDATAENVIAENTVIREAGNIDDSSKI